MSGEQSQLVVKRGLSSRRDARAAARELAEQCADPDAALTLVFVSPSYDADDMASALASAFAPTPVYGCTTAGEIASDGFHRDSVVAMSLTSAGLRVGAGFAIDVTKSAFSGGRQATLQAIAELGAREDELRAHRNVGMTFIDGRCGQEELFIAGAAASAQSIGFVGGSASDHVDVAAARVFYDGRAWADCGLVLVFDSDSPFAIIKSEHMVATDDRVVVTATGPESRVVRELNGRSARAVYEEIIAKDFAGTIDASVAARYPLAYYVGGQPYVRSVMDFSGEDGLVFACAVDRGAVLRFMRPGDLLGTTASDLQTAADEVGGISALIAFNCLGRFLESEATASVEAVAELLCSYPVVGFNTFGEQVNALHVNHTLTALAFGRGGDG